LKPTFSDYAVVVVVVVVVVVAVVVVAVPAVAAVAVPVVAIAAAVAAAVVAVTRFLCLKYKAGGFAERCNTECVGVFPPMNFLLSCCLMFAFCGEFHYNLILLVYFCLL
jgi:hypothetical protein